MEIQLVPDTTIFIMWVIFVVTLSVLTKLVFKPTLKLIEERANQTEQLKDVVGSLIEDTKKNLNDYEEKITQVRMRAVEEREVIVRLSRKEEKAIIEEARSKAEASLLELKTNINREMKEAGLQIRQYSQELAKEIVAQILERKVA